MDGVRAADVGDAAGIASVQMAGRREAYAGILPADRLAALDVDRAAGNWRSLIEGGSEVLVHGPPGAVDGFACSGACRDDDISADVPLELYAIYVGPGARSCGN